MIICKIEYLSTDGTPKELACAWPLQDKRTLDETLDISTIDAVGIEIAQPFEPFTKFLLTVKDLETQQTETIFRYLANDIVEQITYILPYRYTHTLTLIEPAKILEREVCDNLTFTNTLLALNDYKQVEVYPFDRVELLNPGGGIVPDNVIKSSSASYIGAERYMSPLKIRLGEASAKLTIIDLKQTITPVRGSYFPRSKTIYLDGTKVNAGGVYDLNEGLHAVRFVTNGDVEYRKGTVLLLLKYTQTSQVDIFVYSESNPPKKKTYVENLERLLAVTPLRRKGQKQKYKLSQSFRQKYANTESPEFSITSKNLWEALREFGGYLNAIPFMPTWDEIDFIELGSDVRASLPDKYAVNTESYDISQYCTNIDSTVQNVVNVDNEMQGSVTEPYANGYMSVRSESGGIEISEDDAFFPTALPVRTVKKLEAGVGNNFADITSYVLSKTEYDLLSSMNDSLEGSKTYKLYFEEGKQGIHGLTFKRDKTYPLESLKKCAIAKILEFCKVSCSNADIPKIKYRIKYISFNDIRAKQYKTNCLNFNSPSSLIYNQQANEVDSIAYGENLKGTVARLGNPEPVRTYYLHAFTEIPKVGTVTDDGYYISATECEYWGQYIKCTVTFSKDYNKLAEQVGIKNEQRYYEVSERMCTDRNMNYGEFCVIGNKLECGSNSITGAGIQAHVQTFLQANNSYNPAACAILQGVVGGEDQQKILLPISGIAIGNSIALHLSYKDNYAAGVQSESDSAGRNNRLNKAVAYGDKYGAIDDLRCAICIGADSSTEDIANALPAYDGAKGVCYFDFWNKPFYIRKDNREAIRLTYQRHYVQNRSELVIGWAMSQYNPIVSGISAKKVAKILFLPYNVNRFAKYIDSGVGYAGDIALLFFSENTGFSISSIIAPVACRSWAFVTSDKNELILGVNEPLQAGQGSKQIYFNFCDQLG